MNRNTTTPSDDAVSLKRAKRREQRKRDIKRFLRAMFSRKIVVVGAVGTLFFVLVAIFAPLIATHDPNYIQNGKNLLDPSKEFLFGTDLYGRDLFSRVVYGARVSLLTGVLSTLLATIIGTFLGMLAAYSGGVVDMVLMRICEMMRAIPQLVISMTLIAAFGGSMMSMVIILCFGGIWGSLRMMRASALSIMNNDYVLAAKLSGESMLKILYKHILPNSISPIIVSASQSVGFTILMESGLSFLGVGIKVPTASWGSIINEARVYLITNPLYALIPCACLAVLIISLNLLGDGVRDALDPTLRGES
jgi:ABC-type dipeptide/oligopeptide/nickel transport systems, permease components